MENRIMNEPEQTIRKAGRQRSALSHQAILEATLALFAEVGLHGLSIEAIAARAGVGKTTIYRRWTSKEEILSEALYLLRGGLPLPDTGHIRDDFLFLAREAREVFAHDPFMGKLITKMIAELKTTPTLAQAFVEKVIVPHLQEFRSIVERAKRRGEVRADLDTTFILHLIFLNLVYGHLFVELLTPDTQSTSSETIVDALLRGIGTKQAFPDN
jgi:AcrR family transcriptional regulator